MKKFANFLIDRRYILLAIMLVISIVCGVFAAIIPINRDRTKYLADNSNMKKGLDILDCAFPEPKEKASIRVMFDDLTREEIRDVRKHLESIPNVSSVSYDSSSADYNKDNHTLFVINTEFDYNTDEEKAIESAIENGFPEYTMAYKNNDIPLTKVPFWIILLALTLAVIILLIMSHSWLDPILFLITIGFAILINFGTNIFLPYIDEMTATVGPILQLALSMDYSIILMSRYRQEKGHNSAIEAMKTALAASISSIASSSLTTVAGLLALVFLSFKLGPELGIVLAKGVFISMLCVFTILPAMILSLDKWLEKTRKKSPHFSMGVLSKISRKLRYVMPFIFAGLIVSSFIAQRSTKITFSENNDDPLADIFPKDNIILLIYNNNNEQKAIDGTIGELEKDTRVSSVIGYPNTLGKKMKADEMSEAINKLSDETKVEEDIVRMLYFIAKNSKVPAITVGEFLKFISDSVIPNETLNKYMDENIHENAEYFEKFSDREKLTTPMTASEMAEFFDIDKESAEQLYLYYKIQNGVPDSGTMTLPGFVDFVLNTVAKDEIYGSMIDSASLSSLRLLQAYSNVSNVLENRNSSGLASFLRIDESIVKTVFKLHSAGDVSGKTMTVSDFSSYLCNNLLNDPMFSGYFDASTKAQLQKMNELILLAKSKQALRVDRMARVLGMQEKDISGLYYLYFYSTDPSFKSQVDGMTMTISDFLNLLKPNASGDQLTRLTQMEQLINLAASGQQLDVAAMASIMNMRQEQISGLYYLYFSSNPSFQAEVAGMSMSLSEFLPLLKANASGDQLTQLTQMENLINLAVSGQQIDAATMAGITGVPAVQVSAIYNGAETMSLQAFLNAALLLDPSNANLQKLNYIANLATSGAQGAATLAQVFGIQESQVLQLFGLKLASQKTVALADFTGFLVSSGSVSLSPEQTAQLQQMNNIVQLAAAGTAVDAATLAQIFEITSEQVKQVYGLPLASQRSVALADFTGFLVSSVLSNPAYSGNFSAEQAAQLQQMNNIVQLAASDTLLDANELAQVFGMDVNLVKTVFRLYFSADTSGKTMSVRTFTNYILSDPAMSGMMDSASLEQLRSLKAIMEASINGTQFTSSRLASFLGMDRSETEKLYILRMSKNGQGASWMLTPQNFVSFAVTDLLGNSDYAEYFDDKTADDLRLGHTLIEAVVSGKAYTVKEMTELLMSLTDDVSEKEVELMYLYYGGVNDIASDTKMTIPQFFEFLIDDMINDERFDSYFDEETKADILSSEKEINDALKQMRGDNYSRFVITSDYADESPETYAYLAKLKEICDAGLGEYYLVGNSAMVSEMNETFDRENLMITLITAISVFLVVLVAFRNPTLPIILTLVVQCGVFITVTVIGAYTGHIYYLALLIVQSILMGATIDYGIVFCNYYLESRDTMDMPEALKAAYEGSIHTIMTSGSILVLVLGILGIFATSTMISEVSTTLSIGAFIALTLILLVLPGLVACCDGLIIKKRE